ncbi:MAG: hypothetical protein LBP31_00775 [Holosporales bacterium]|nr:hypothetical protein [Holosporales bacterium]
MILIFSGGIFAIGLCGCVFRSASGLVMTLISVELMILASVVNFCSVSHTHGGTGIGYIFSVVSIIMSGLILSIIFMAYTYNRRDYEDCN